MARSARTEGLIVVGDSARGSEVTDLSRSRLGDAALRAARERWDWSVQILDTEISMYARFVVNLLLLFAMVVVLKNYQSRGVKSLSIKKKFTADQANQMCTFFRANMHVIFLLHASRHSHVIYQSMLMLMLAEFFCHIYPSGFIDNEHPRRAL